MSDNAKVLHLDRYDGELWCAAYDPCADYVICRADDEDPEWAAGEVPPIDQVTCIACLDAAAAFGERCKARREALSPSGERPKDGWPWEMPR